MDYYRPTQIREMLHVEQIYTIHYFEYNKDYVFSGERHDFWELLYVDKGEVLVAAGDKELRLLQGQLVFHQPGEFHRVAANGSIAPNTIVISFSCNDAAMDALRGRVCYVNSRERQMLASIISEARAAFSTRLGDPEYRQLCYREDAQPGSAQMIRLYLETLLIGFIRKRRNTAEPAGSTIQQNTEAHYFDSICRYIDDNIDISFTLEGLSQQAMVSASQLERLFKRYAGMSAIQYCNRRKVERAKQFIREDRMNITQIAEALGFSSIHYFSRIFKQWEGMSPSQYGRSVKSMEDHAGRMLRP